MRKAIESGGLKPGERLPTELQLVRATPYSLGTVQRAVRSLVEAGMITRSPKLGTFVRQPRKRVDDASWHFRFLDSDRQTLLPVYLTAVYKEEIQQRGPWNDFLHGPILRIDRLADVNEEFRAYSRFFVVSPQFPLLRRAATKSLHGKNFRMMLDREILEPITRIFHRISTGPATARISRAIGVDADVICTTIEIAAAKRGDEYVYYQELTVPPSRRRLVLADPVLVGEA